MYWLIKELSPNLFFIIFMVFLYQYWFEQKDWTSVIKNWVTFFTCAITIILCMSFPVHVGQNFIYDLRNVPLILGSLYGNTYVAIGLASVTLIARYFSSGILGFYISVIVVGIGLLLVYLIRGKFHSLKSNHRLLTATIIVTFLVLVVSILSETLTANSNHASLNISDWLAYIIANIMATFIAGKIVESVRTNDLVRKRLLRNEKLEIVSHLASSISHEVRNPLTASRGFLQLLSEEDIPKKCEKYITIAIDEMDRAEGVIRDYLTFAKPAFEHAEIFQVEDELVRAINVIKPLANMNNITMESTLLPSEIKGERARLQQCFMNLMKNAIEAMPNGGKLLIESKVEKGYVTISISDTGVGMTKEQVSRLGEPYFSTKGMKGTGLGMMVVYRIVESFDGVIEVESEIGQGTTFTLKIPSISKQTTAV
ncbi:sensor histidine kinase [Bacillus solimangrovi]|uniref:histidine kinase n=1 Tax=Bacillus solimangrovi TaxID=1305675 RepID=A0A1E5LIX5_9BACI|nr:sensor histidine kinase [Bacillus solimangrovi]OEH94042.1 two-component sensor histidine kinase [Bacillus solimangrovi]